MSAFAEPQLYMAGDSIMADYRPDMFPQYGWGGSAVSPNPLPHSKVREAVGSGFGSFD